MALLGRKKIGREDHEKKQRRIDRLAEDWEEVGGSFNDSFQSFGLCKFQQEPREGAVPRRGP